MEGLNCANCADKIEEQVNRLEEVSQATVNFATKTLIIRVNVDGNIPAIIERANAIIQKLEPGVIIKEKTIRNISGEKILFLKGLDCVNCAAKIEKAVRNIEGVRRASVDFVTKKLNIEVEHKRDLARIVSEASLIAVQIESGIKVVEEKASSDLEEERKLAEFLPWVIGAVLFLVAVLFDFSFYVELGLFVVSYLLVGGEVVLRAFKNIFRGQVFDENFLMTIATLGAFAIQQFPEGVAVMLFYQIGELFQDLAVNHSRRSISALMDIRPDYANIKIGNDFKRIPPEEVKIGEIIIIRPGEKVPLDGLVIEGRSTLDTSAITGESLPREVEPGSEVLSGTINKNGLLTVEVRKEFRESTVSKILKLVENASAKKAPTEKFITKFARYYTPAVVFFALAIATVPPILVADALFADWIYRALIFLVVSCPCALVISIPLSFFGGIGGASKNGILIKGSNYLEALNNVDTVVFDKTGTLSKGIFVVTKVQASGALNEGELLELAAHAESYSTHPIAASIIREYGKVLSIQVEDYDEISGHGIKATVKGQEILAGNSRLMERENIKFSEAEELGAIVYIAINGMYVGYIVISDEVKEDSKSTVLQLRKIGVKRLVMLTGDRKDYGERLAGELGLDEVYTELLPDRKVEILERLEEQRTTKGKLIFVGDGINDAPALTKADVGIAMGGIGSDAAIEAADIVIMTDEPSKIVSAIKIAKKTNSIVWQNIIFAFVIKTIVMILGAGGMATMWEAVFADVGVALIAVFNAMRILKVRDI